MRSSSVLLFTVFAFASSKDLAPSCESDDSALLQQSVAETKNRDKTMVTEKENWNMPDLGDFGDKVNDMTKGATDSIAKVSEAVDAGKELAIQTFKEAAEQVNASLDVIRKKIQEVNSTALPLVEKMQKTIEESKDKVPAFKKSAAAVLQTISESVNSVVAALKKAEQTTEQGLELMGQKESAEAFHSAMKTCFATIETYQSSLTSLEASLADTEADTKADTNASLLARDAESPEELAAQLRAPMQKLREAATKLQDLGEEALQGFDSFVQAGMEAATKNLPVDLVPKIKSIVESVQAHANLSLQPMAAIANDQVDTLYSAANDAGVPVDKSGAVSLSPVLLAAFSFLLQIL